MSFYEKVIGFAALWLPANTRGRHWEQWLADLRDAKELGLSRGQITRGAVRFSARALRRSVTGTAVRASFSWWQLVAAVGLLGIFLYVLFPADALLGGQKVGLRDHFDVFSQFMNTPFIQLTPVIVVMLSCTRFARDQVGRSRSGRKAPRRVETFTVAKLLVGCSTAFLVFFAWTILAFTIAFTIWPAIGDPSIQPQGYGLTAASAIADSFHRTTYSQLLAAGPWAYAVLFSTWVGFGASVYAALGMAALLVIRSRGAAFAIPFVIYFGETAVAEMLGSPSAALSFSMFPFGLVQQTIATGAAPTLILAVCVVGFWALILRRQIHREQFA